MTLLKMNLLVCQFNCLQFIFVETKAEARYTVKLFGKSVDTISARQVA